MKVIAIAAVAKNGVIGRGSELPWHIPEDMKFFRESTKNHIVIMGRKTLDALGKPLPHRENAVITRDVSALKKDPRIGNGLVFSNVKEAIDYYLSRKSQFSGKHIFVIGGAQIYEASFDLLDEIWLTEIDSAAEGDIFFPHYRDGKLQSTEFQRVKSIPQQDLNSPYRYHFNEFHRKI